MTNEKHYHHGTLKAALCRAALDLIVESGPKGFTLREAARRAGVSHNAPYRHFRDKEELLAEVAADGFERLLAHQRAAVASETTAAGRLLRAGESYVDFALRNPAHFQVMFDALPDPKVSPRLQSASAVAFEALVDWVKGCQQEGAVAPGDPVEKARFAWSLVHGIAELSLAGQYRLHSPEEVLTFCRHAGEVLMKGLA